MFIYLVSFVPGISMCKCDLIDPTRAPQRNPLDFAIRGAQPEAPLIVCNIGNIIGVAAAGLGLRDIRCMWE